MQPDGIQITLVADDARGEVWVMESSLCEVRVPIEERGKPKESSLIRLGLLPPLD